jgi:hypothetical protein
VTPTRKTDSRTEPIEAESEPAVEVAPEPGSEQKSASTAETPDDATTEVMDATQVDAANAAPEESGASEPAEAESAAADPVAAESSTAEPAGPEAGAEQTPTSAPLTPTQLLNDPLLGTHDDIIADLGVKLRWASVAYALLGLVASWVIAAQAGIATKSGTPFAWALAASILILVGGAWYFADVSTRFVSVASYRKAKTPQAIARLRRGAVVGMYSVIGAWIGVALGALVVVSGTVTAVVTLAFGVSGWAWFFGGVPAVLLYVYGFGLLHYRLLEKARDAVA